MADAADALYREALAACERGRVAEGVAILEQARALAPAEPRIHALLGQALIHLGRYEDALGSLDRALAVGVSNASLHGNRADALAALGRREEAVQGYDRALAIKPDSVNEWCNRGATLQELGRHEEAAESFGRAAALAPGFAPAHYNRGIALAALKRHEPALVSLDRALALAPDYADAHNNRANSLDQLGRLVEALAAVERALALAPDHRAALVTRAVILRKLGRAGEAVASCDRALTLEADDAEALIVRGDALVDLERFEDAAANFERMIALDPQAALPKWNKSFICLGLGYFAEGWRLYEHRWAGAKGLVPRAYPQPRWSGGRVDGTLLVWGEQGLGDEILHASMIPDLMQRTGSVTLEVESRLVPLFARSFPGANVIPLGPSLSAGPFAAQTPIASLGRHFRPSFEAFPKRDRGYLVADGARSRALRQRLDDGRRVIGLSWVSKAPIGGAQKSARLVDFAPLLRAGGYRFVDLQYGDTHAEREVVERELGVRVERLADIDNTNDLDGLAALMSACDAVVTVSNTTAHLAGALGRPTIVMVPHGHARIWYWFRDRDESPWYPRVRVRRQQRGQAWSELIAAVAAELPER
ncbi:MAG: tetratricopeptide repeat protein [Xanthobacteraceae bacterium]|nr:tetratricopeptide repeat protein [Xanthobacteraceae bacterium]